METLLSAGWTQNADGTWRYPKGFGAESVSLNDALKIQKITEEWVKEGNAVGEPLASPQLTTATETCGGI